MVDPAVVLCLRMDPSDLRGQSCADPFSRVAQHIAVAPYRADIAVFAHGSGQLLAQFANVDVDDLTVRFIDATIKVIKKLLLGQCLSLSQ